MKQVTLFLNNNKIFKHYFASINKLEERKLDTCQLKGIVPEEGNIFIYFDNEDSDIVDNLYSAIIYYLITDVIDIKKDDYMDMLGCNDDEFKKLSYEIVKNDGIYSLIYLEIKRFFNNNNIFKENVFLNFNIPQLKDEIYLTMSEIYQNKKNNKNYLNEIKKKFKDTHFDVDKFKSILLNYNETNQLTFISMYDKNNFFTYESFKNKVGIEVVIKTNMLDFDEWQMDICFCIFVCKVLEVKELHIPIEYKDFYDEMEKSAKQLIDRGLKLILEE